MLIASQRIVTASPAGRGAPAILSPGYVACSRGEIVAVGAGPPPGRPDVALTDGILLPGLVDLQVNGYFGVELGEARQDGWVTVAGGLPATGTTAFLPTFITGPFDGMLAALGRAAGFAPDLAGSPGLARVLGVHVEGPFLSPRRLGAHNPAWIARPEPAAVDALLAAGRDLLRVLTLAPELDGALAAIRQLTASGVLVSVGHSDATAAQVSAAAMCGARMVTHLFNAQRPLHHREPGVAGQALADTRLSSGLIADLHHVCGPVAAIAFAAAPGRIFLVTDAAAAAGGPAGRYLLGGEAVELAAGDGTPPVRPDGTLAGSVLRMDAAIANMVAAGVSLTDAVAAATRIPADLIGRPDLGRIAEGAAADLVWVTDGLRTQAAWIAGRQVFGPPLG